MIDKLHSRKFLLDTSKTKVIRVDYYQQCLIELQQDELKINVSWVIKVLYMLFDTFLLAVESRDLSQVDKILIRVSSFPKLSDG